MKLLTHFFSQKSFMEDSKSWRTKEDEHLLPERTDPGRVGATATFAGEDIIVLIKASKTTCASHSQKGKG